MTDGVRGCTLLLVDDEEANLDLLEVLLRDDGYDGIVRTSDARQAIPLWERHCPDLVLLDLHMPYRDGFAILHDIRTLTPADDYRPVLVLTADVSGPVNLTGPAPVTNAEFTRRLGAAVHRPTFLAVPRFAISLALGEFGRSSVLAGQRAVPKVLETAGFTFSYRTLDDALKAALAGE